jgi:tetratricopeptide (TPR) repeat protein
MADYPTSRGSTILFLAAALAVGIVAALPWWHTIDAPEPVYVKGARFFLLVCAICLALAAVRPQFRPASILAAGAACLLLPVLILLVVATRDPSSVERVIRQDDQAHWLLTTVRQDEDMPYVPWTDPTHKSIVDVFSNAYTVLDAVETASFFTQTGWFASLAIGFMIVIGGGAYYARPILRILARRRAAIALACAVAIVFLYGHLTMAYYFWNSARMETAGGNYKAALADYRSAAIWDPRWNDDILYHVELGRLYGRLGMRDQQDYWASVADAYTKAQDYSRAYALYVEHVRSAASDGAMRVRFVNAVLHQGLIDFNAGRQGLAVQEWQTAAALDPTDIQTLYYLAIAQSKMGDYGDSIKTWKSVVRMNESVGMFRIKWFTTRDYRKPITSIAWNNMAWCYFQLHDYRSAMDCHFNSTVQGKTDPAVFADPLSDSNYD